MAAVDDALLEYRDPATIALDPKNARKHPPHQLEVIRGLIRRFGFRSAVLVDEQGQLIAGEARILAARAEKVARVPVLVCTGLSPEERAALALADNRAPLDAEWDLDVLSSTMRWLQTSGFDVDGLGFSPEEVSSLLTVDAGGLGNDPDVVPEPPVDPVSKFGSVWHCGPHKVVCGDATEVESYNRLLGTERVDCVWTDPPYNVDYDGKASLRGGVSRKIKGDDQTVGAFSQMLAYAFRRAFEALKAGGAIYVAHSETERAAFTSNLTQQGFKLAGVVIWRKDSLVLGRSDWQWIHEPILYGWKPGAKHRWFGGRKQTTVQEMGGMPFRQREDGKWEVVVGDRAFVVEGSARVDELASSIINEPKPRKADLHPTMKPTALIERMLKNSARPGDLVLDPFGGSGSTLLACDRMGMSARLLELDPKYADVIVRRWEAYTGRTAELVLDGSSA